MKSDREMADAVFRRRDEYVTRQRQRKRTVVRVSALSGCLGLVMLAGFGLNRKYSAHDDIFTVDFASLASREEGESTVTVISQCQTYAPDLVINRIDGISSTRKMNICLFGEDFVRMNKEELKEYYGTGIFPTVPSDLQEWEPESGYGIYKRDGGKGEVYYSQAVINYSNKEITRSVNIEVEKGRMPFSDYGSLSADCEKSIVGGTEVGIGKTDSGCYLAEFLYQNAGFRIVTEGLTEEEMLAVLSSLIR